MMGAESRKLFGLIGKPLAHSWSQRYFTEKFLRENIVADYENFPLENVDQFPSLINTHPRLKGLNVTIPYKEQVTAFVDELEDAAIEIGAVNTIKVLSGKLSGFNTDGYAFMASISKMIQPVHHAALILGTGGSAKAIAWALRKMGIAYDMVSRNPEEHELGYDDLHEDVIHQFKIVINATPIGMFPDADDCPPIPYDFLSTSHLLFDLIYNPEETSFLRKGKEKGAIIKNGLEMLELQAEKSWEIWNT